MKVRDASVAVVYAAARAVCCRLNRDEIMSAWVADLEKRRRPELSPLAAAPYQRAAKVVPNVDQEELFGEVSG